MKLLKNIGLLLVVLSSVYFFTACNKESVTSSVVDTLTDQTIYSLEARGNLGKHGCYDLVFPVSVKLTDGTIIMAPNADSLRSAIRRWHSTQNPSNRPQRPDFVFPIQVIAEDGSIMNVASEADLQVLRATCHKPFLDSLMHRDSLGHHDFPRHDTICFTFIFPLQVKKADGTTVTVKTKEELIALTKSEHAKGPGQGGPGGGPGPFGPMGPGGHHGIPNQLQIVFPVTVTKADGTKVEVKSETEWMALRKGC